MLLVELCPSKRYIQVLTPGTWNVTLLGPRVFANKIKLRGGHGGGSNPTTGVFLRRGGIGYVHREDQEIPCDDEAETGGTCLQAKDSWQPEKLRGKEGPCSRSFRGSMALPTARFWASSHQNCEKISLSCFGHPVCRNLPRSHGKWIRQVFTLLLLCS